MVEIAKAFERWKRKRDVTIKLLPQNFVDNVRPFIKQSGFKCTYNLIDGKSEIFDVVADVRPITGGLFVNLKNVSKKALIQININTKDGLWTSDFEPVEQYKINLKKEEISNGS